LRYDCPMKPTTKKTTRKPNQTSQRQLRVGEELRHALAGVMFDIGFVTPELEGVSITISQVEMSPDLRHANVFVTALGKSSEEAAVIIKSLNKHSGYFRHEVDRRVALKFSAKLKFIHDTSFDTAAKLENILRHPGEGRDPEQE
jgi:ribosome-binding factor A